MMGSGDATEMTLFGRGGTGKFFGGASGLTSPDAGKFEICDLLFIKID